MDIYYEIKGEGYPVVLLHGNGENMHIFDDLVSLLSKKYQCICIDSRYHGKSIKSGELTYEQLCKDVMNVCDELKLTEYSVIGFSDGGIVSLLLSLNDSRLKHMICIGANTFAKAVKPIYYYTDLLKRIIYIPFTLYHPKAKLLIRYLDLMLKMNSIPYSALNDVKIPSLILCGEYDMIKYDDSKKIAESLPYGILKVIPRGNHFLISDFFNETSKEILLFLEACHNV